MQVLMGCLPWDLEYMRRGVRFRMKRDYSVNKCGVVDDNELRGKDE